MSEPVEPKVIGESNGKKVYWCRFHGRQLPEDLCKGKYFRNTGRNARHCRVCLGIAYGKPFPEPWASKGKEEKPDAKLESDNPGVLVSGGVDHGPVDDKHINNLVDGENQNPGKAGHDHQGDSVLNEEVKIDDGRPPTLPGM